MGRTITISASDGHTLTAHESRPAGTPRGGLIVLSEIYGLNHHIRGVADGYAAAGYHVVAPALYDRIGPGIELGYTPEDSDRARASRAKLGWDQVLADIEGARRVLAPSGKTAVLGYCFGGTGAWLSAARLPGFSAAICYYATQMAPVAEEKPLCPVLMHFGETDHLAPLAVIGKIRGSHGAIVEIQLYATGHGFNCNERDEYHAPSAALALARSLAFLGQHIG